MLATAKISLTKADQTKGLAKLLFVGRETHTKRSLRNAVAHSGFERSVRMERRGKPGVFSLVPEEMTFAENAHSLVRGKDPHEEVPRIVEEFRTHRERVRAIHTWLWMGFPEDADETLLNKDQ